MTAETDLHAPEAGTKERRCRAVAECRPAGLVLGELATCTRLVRSNLGDPQAPTKQCGYVTAWRLLGAPWCERCWWTTRSGLEATARLRSERTA
jgi:hypothetical protein